MVLICIIAVILNPLVFAITPHINKGTLNEISVETACTDLKISPEKLKRFETEYTKDFFDLIFNGFKVEKIDIFRQTFTETKDVLYRVMLEGKAGWVLTGDDRIQYQKVYFKGDNGKTNLLYADFYWTDIVHGTKERHEIRKNVMPIIKHNKIAGIMVYEIESYVTYKIIDDDLNTDKIYSDDTAAEVFWSDDLSSADMRLYHGAQGDAEKFSAGETTYNNHAYDYQELKPDITIESSKPLIDEKDPFKYTIQNAFDKNSATSYVEDTDDDLMSIEFIFHRYETGKAVSIEKISLINGYAASQKLYFENNRIKTFYFDSYSINFGKNEEKERENFLKSYKDIILPESPAEFYFSIPKLSFNSFSFSVDAIYKGNKYKDTCLAEFNFYGKDYGWFFGESK